MKFCPLVLVPKVSIFSVLGMNGDEGLLLMIRGLLRTTGVSGPTGDGGAHATIFCMFLCCSTVKCMAVDSVTLVR